MQQGQQTATQDQVRALLRGLFGYLNDTGDRTARDTLALIRREHPGFVTQNLRSLEDVVRYLGHIDGVTLVGILQRLADTGQIQITDKNPLFFAVLRRRQQYERQQQQADQQRQDIHQNAQTISQRTQQPIPLQQRTRGEDYIAQEDRETLTQIGQRNKLKGDWWAGERQDVENIIASLPQNQRAQAERILLQVSTTNPRLRQRLQNVQIRRTQNQTDQQQLRNQAQGAPPQQAAAIQAQLLQLQQEEGQLQEEQEALERVAVAEQAGRDRTLRDSSRYTRRKQADPDRIIQERKEERVREQVTRRMQQQGATQAEIDQEVASTLRRRRVRTGMQRAGKLVQGVTRGEIEQAEQDLRTRIRDLQDTGTTPSFAIQSIAPNGQRTTEPIPDVAKLAYPQLMTADGDIRRTAVRRRLSGEKTARIRAIERLDEEQTMARNIGRQITERVEQEILRTTGTTGPDVEPGVSRALRIGQRVAQRVQDRVAQRYNDLVGSLGHHEAQRRATEFLISDPEMRQEISEGVIEAFVDSGMDVPQASASADQAVPMVISGIAPQAQVSGDTRTDITPLQIVHRNVEYDLVSQRRLSKAQQAYLQSQNYEGRVLIRKETQLANDNGHIIPLETERMLMPDGTSMAAQYSRWYRFGRWFDQRIRARTPREQQYLQQRRDAFVSGMIDYEQQFRKDPLGALFRLPLDIAHGILPPTYKNLSLGTRSALLSAAFLPLGAYYYANERYKMFQKQYAPVLNTMEYTKWYTEGQVNAVASMLLPGFTYDYKSGKLVPPGIGMLSRTYNGFVETVGSAFLDIYNRRFRAVSGDADQIGFWARRFKSMGLRLKDKQKNRNPVSLFILAPLSNLLIQPFVNMARNAAIWALEKTRVMHVVRRFANAVGGEPMRNLGRTWRYGGGYADRYVVDEMRFNAYQRATERLGAGSQELAREIQKIDRNYNILWRSGQTVRAVSGTWRLTKIGLGAGLRFGAIYLVSHYLFGFSPLASAGIASAYAVPWGLQKLATNDFFGGKWIWADDATKLTGTYQPGALFEGFIGRFYKAYNTPFGRRWALPSSEAGLFAKSSATAVKLFPTTGVFWSTILALAGVPLPIAMIPVAVDFGLRVGGEIAATELGFKIGKWFTRITRGANVFISIGQLSYALSQGGVGGLFDVFRNPNLANALKFSTVPLTTLAYAGLFKAFLAAGASLGPIGWLAAIAATVATIAFDEALRYFTGKGIYGHVISPLLDKLWGEVIEPVLEQTAEKFAGAISMFVGAIGIIMNAMKGNLQGIIMGVVMMVIGGTLIFAIPVPAAYFTGGANITNRWFEGYKELIWYENKEDGLLLHYYYSYLFRNVDAEIRPTMFIHEEDAFTGFTDEMIRDPIVNVRGDGVMYSHLPASGDVVGSVVTVADTKTSVDIDGVAFVVRREFEIQLNADLEELFGDSGGEICNTVVVNILDPKWWDRGGRREHTEAPVKLPLCQEFAPPYTRDRVVTRNSVPD